LYANRSSFASSAIHGQTRTGSGEPSSHRLGGIKVVSESQILVKGVFIVYRW
jgi:hypothetical protein